MADNNELTQSLPSCNNTLIQIVEPASEMELVMQDQHQTYAVHQSLLQQHQNYQIVMQQQQMQLQQQQQQNSQQGKNPNTFKTMMKNLMWENIPSLHISHLILFHTFSLSIDVL